VPLEQRDKELAAIGASIGSNCAPCIEHHLVAGREAGLSQAELDAAVASAHAVRREAVELLATRIDELLGHRDGGAKPAPVPQTSTASALVGLGVSVGANSHSLLHAHVGSALDAGLELHEVKSALKMAGYVQQHAAALTAEAVTRTLTERVGAAAGVVAPAR
jgi:AhpD family alkylhydroperoxidase